jgi:hypothetical protein
VHREAGKVRKARPYLFIGKCAGDFRVETLDDIGRRVSRCADAVLLSLTVGTSGSAANRLALVTPSAQIRPARID